MKFAKMTLICICLTGMMLGCGNDQNETQSDSQGEPNHLAVQHLLIAFKGSGARPSVTRTQEEAKTLAFALFERAKSGEDFDVLVKEFTDDSPPGIFKMSNTGITPDRSKQEYERRQLVPAFGDVGFTLKTGEVGIAIYDPVSSPYGWHIIKRIE